MRFATPLLSLLCLCASLAGASPARAGGVVVTVEMTQVPRPPAPAPLDEKRLAQAKKIYDARCSLCHGATGAGDGPVGANLTPKPRRLTDALWQASVDDAALAQVILEGGASRKLAPTMLANPDLKHEPGAVDALIAFIRSLRAPHGTARATLQGGGFKSAPTSAADANDKGVARVAFGGVPPGPITVVGHTPAGELCRAEAVVADKPLTLTCAPATAAPAEDQPAPASVNNPGGTE